MMISPKLFNPKGTELGKIWGGDTPNYINLNNASYPWAVRCYKQMESQFWVPESIDLSEDFRSKDSLTDKEKISFSGVISYLNFLDSLQVRNLPNINGVITSPEVCLCLTAQAFQEAIHVKSYQTILDAIEDDPEQREFTYNFWRTDPILRTRCEAVTDFYSNYLDSGKVEEYLLALLANYLLEGILFHNGFVFFYSLAARGLYQGVANMIRLIHRDENVHVRIFQELIKQARKDFPSSMSIESIHQIVDTTVNMETSWTGYIFADNPGTVSAAKSERFTKYLANLRLKAIGVPPLYPNVINPYKNLIDNVGDVDGVNSKANFFETNVTSYYHESAGNWDIDWKLL